MKNLIESKRFEQIIVTLIALNAISLGLETSQNLSREVRDLLFWFDKAFLTCFVFEILAKAWVYRLKFFADPWRCFDFAVVGIALVPASGPLSILRSLRILRTLRMISVVPSLRRVVNGLLVALPGLGGVSIIMILVFYVGAVISTRLFGDAFPQWFGDVWLSSYSLFQVMTLESWSMGIVRPVMAVFPYAWMFFLPFILLTTFTMLNLFIAVIVNAMQAETDQAADDRAQQSHDERMELLKELKLLRKEISEIKRA